MPVWMEKHLIANCYGTIPSWWERCIRTWIILEKILKFLEAVIYPTRPYYSLISALLSFSGMAFWQLIPLRQVSAGPTWYWLRGGALPGDGELWSKVTVILQWLQELLLTQILWEGQAVSVPCCENKGLPKVQCVGGYKALLKETEMYWWPLLADTP